LVSLVHVHVVGEGWPTLTDDGFTKYNLVN